MTRRGPIQRGQVLRAHASWAYRLYHGPPGQRKRKQRSGFATQDEALAALEVELRHDRLGTLATDLYPPRVTLGELVDEYLAQHQAEESTIATLTHRLGYAKEKFGALDVARLTVREVSLWRARLPEGSRRGIHQALRQALGFAVAIGAVKENVALKVPNPDRRRGEIHPFHTWDEIDLIADEIDPRYSALPIFAAGTGLRPEEWIALERKDIDRKERVVIVRRTVYQGKLREYAKTDRSRRRVPLRARVLEALDAQATLLGEKLLWPAPEGGYLNLHNWRRRSWRTALEAAGWEDPLPRIYDCRHTYAAWSIAAGVSLYHLARFMGTSVQMIDRTYGHLLPDADGENRALLDAWDARGEDEEAEVG